METRSARPMRSRRLRALVAVGAAVFLAAGPPACGGGGEQAPAAPDAAPDESEARALAERAAAALGALPDVAAAPDRPLTPERIDLGRMLYYETRLSRNDDISCNTCHPLDRFGADGQRTSEGHVGQLGDRNSPSVYNAALQFAQFWDGRAADVEEQAKGPILNPIEMAMSNEAEVLAVLKSIPDYPGLFAAAFAEQGEDAVTYDNLALAIGAFERKLITPGRFDDFVNGDLDALSATEQRGLELFLDVGCITCHVGPTVGGTMFQKLGLVQPYETLDTGRYKVTDDEADKYVFKVPSLRNVAETAPYFHDGSIATLHGAVAVMARHQLGKELTAEQIRLLVAFLETLTGRIDHGYVAQPELPESGPTTPAPSTS